MSGNDTATMAGWVKELRARTGMTQKQLGERCGVSTQYVTYIETGRRCPGRPVVILMRQISDVIHMPPPPDCAWSDKRHDEDE